MEDGTSKDKFTDAYSDESFWEKVGKYALTAGKKVIELALTLYYALMDPETPKTAKATILAALGYFIVPTDAIPDPTPVVGFSDDYGVLLLAAACVAASIKPEHREKAREKMSQWFGRADDGKEAETAT